LQGFLVYATTVSALDASISARDIMPTMRQSAMLFSLQYVFTALIDVARTFVYLRPILISKTCILFLFIALMMVQRYATAYTLPNLFTNNYKFICTQQQKPRNAPRLRRIKKQNTTPLLMPKAAIS